MHDDGPVSQHAAADDMNGIALWNALSEPERGQWTARAGNTGQAKDAWEAFERDSHGADLAGLDDESRAGPMHHAGSVRPLAATASPIRTRRSIPSRPRSPASPMPASNST
jgi:hypothetical protein